MMLVGGFGGGRRPGPRPAPHQLRRSASGATGTAASSPPRSIYLGVALHGCGPGSGWAATSSRSRVGGRAVLTTAAVWLVPMLVTPPLFTRDVFSYLAQGALPLAGFDPYAVGPEAMPGIFTDNVHYFWQDTPAPYGPLFILLAKAVAWAIGDNIIAGVLLMRLPSARACCCWCGRCPSSPAASAGGCRWRCGSPSPTR